MGLRGLPVELAWVADDEMGRYWDLIWFGWCWTMRKMGNQRPRWPRMRGFGGGDRCVGHVKD